VTWHNKGLTRLQVAESRKGCTRTREQADEEADTLWGITADIAAAVSEDGKENGIPLGCKSRRFIMGQRGAKC
jgi:hypothetical protein